MLNLWIFICLINYLPSNLTKPKRFLKGHKFPKAKFLDLDSKSQDLWKSKNQQANLKDYLKHFHLVIWQNPKDLLKPQIFKTKISSYWLKIIRSYAMKPHQIWTFLEKKDGKDGSNGRRSTSCSQIVLGMYYNEGERRH